MDGQTAVKNPRLADLFGLAGKEIIWGRLVVYAAALVLAGLVDFLLSHLLFPSPPGYRAWNLMTVVRVPLVYTAAVFVGYKFFRKDWQSAVVAGFVCFVLFNLLGWAFLPTFQWNLNRLYAWLAAFLMLFGMSVALRIFHFWFLALFLGLVFADLVLTIVNQAVFLATVPNAGISLSSQLLSFLGSVMYNVVFVLGFWGGLHLPFCRPEALGMETPAVPSMGLTEDRRLKALDFLALKGLLRRSGIGSLIFAPIAITLGLLTMKQVEVNGLLVVFGIVLLFEGIWILAKPSPSGLIVDGIILVFLGFWNLVISVVNVSARSGGNPGFFLLIGVAQIIQGVSSIRQHRRFRHATGMAVDPEQILMARQWIDEVQNSDLDRTPDIVDMKIRTPFSEIPWRGKLLKDRVVFLAKKTPEIYLKKDVDIQEKGEVSPGGPLKVVLKLEKRAIKARIEMPQLDRFRRWKSA